jgi:lambda repressor-like predicted transcriptional regulator
MIEALFPSLLADVATTHELMLSTPEAKQAKEELDAEEARFAATLRRLMEERQMTQEKLAKITGVSQPAISNMLNRKCRPQRRTISRFAAALDVDPSELWPDE